jgi:transcriptional regulator with XRE-family HTH domain
MINASKEKKYIGGRLKMYRANRHITLSQLAELSQINTAQLSRYENNQAVPNTTVIQKLSNALGVSCLDLTGPTIDNMEELKKLYERLKDLPESEIKIVNEILERILISYRARNIQVL